MADAWAQLDEAVSAPKESRLDRLGNVLTALDLDPMADAADRAELQAVVQCEIASLGVSTIDTAVGAVNVAEGHHRTGWPNYYLAKAAVELGAHQLALESLHKIPKDFFAERDLFWRTVHCWELGAIARLELRDSMGAQVLVDQIAGALASRGESDDLAPPRDLVNYLLSRLDVDKDVQRELLLAIATSVDLRDWFDDRLATRICEAIDPPTAEPPGPDLGMGLHL